MLKERLVVLNSKLVAKALVMLNLALIIETLVVLNLALIVEAVIMLDVLNSTLVAEIILIQLVESLSLIFI